MLTELSSFKDSEIRNVCKEKIESLEHWLRRLIEDTLTPVYGDYFNCADSAGNRLIKSELARQVAGRRASEPLRYPRKIDAVLLENAIDILCNPELFRKHFRSALDAAFPDGREEARTFLSRLLAPRNNLAHANAISVRQAEQIICYSNDVIDSLKGFYREMGMQEAYDVPLILKVTDSFGSVFARAQCDPSPTGGIQLNLVGEPQMHLRPGDVLTIELEIDPSFDPSSYGVTWASTKPWCSSPVTGTKAVIPIMNKQVGQRFDIQCSVRTTRDWHRLQEGVDDFLILVYQVLPPIT